MDGHAPFAPGRQAVPHRGHGRRLALVSAAAILAAGCGGSADTGGDAGPTAAVSSGTTSAPVPEPSPTVAPPSPATDGIALTTSDSEFGPMLFDQAGQAIYLFEKETTGRPDCYGECAVAWPPVLTAGSPQPTGAVRADLLGTVQRDDGSTQVTYGGHPLYFYAHEGPGQVLCHDVVENGGRWLVVTPEGTPGPV